MVNPISLLFAVLFIIALYKFIDAIRRNQKTLIIVYGICLALIMYPLIGIINSQRSYQKYKNEVDKKSLVQIQNGDSSFIEGVLTFQYYNSPVWQDSMESLSKKLGPAMHLAISLNDKRGGAEYTRQRILLTQAEFDSLSQYFNVRRQMKDTISYRLSIQAVKVDREYNEWKMLKLIKIDSIRKLPPVELMD